MKTPYVSSGDSGSDAECPLCHGWSSSVRITVNKLH
jgi:hypothetical protein